MGEIGEWSRVLKEHRKRQRDLGRNTPKRRCRDWILIKGGVHYARNRSSSTRYCRVLGTTRGMKVIGVGSVELVVKATLGGMGIRKIRLDDVLHMPDAVCNVFNPTRKKSNFIIHDHPTETMVWVARGENLFYASVFRGYRRLVLADSVLGESFLKDIRAMGKLVLGITLCEDMARYLGMRHVVQEHRLPTLLDPAFAETQVQLDYPFYFVGGIG